MIFGLIKKNRHYIVNKKTYEIFSLINESNFLAESREANKYNVAVEMINSNPPTLCFYLKNSFFRKYIFSIKHSTRLIAVFRETGENTVIETKTISSYFFGLWYVICFLIAVTVIVRGEGVMSSLFVSVLIFGLMFWGDIVYTSQIGKNFENILSNNKIDFIKTDNHP
ncbi:MAG: hypothetical protein HYR66_13440 [Sphingobacteriales bacterium]|nr:hypothetical protein [Sphingobacteriales bacterium]MBI3719040.1 hypothetical protein [Sphingobacteriales bacterium]